LGTDVTKVCALDRSQLFIAQGREALLSPPTAILLKAWNVSVSPAMAGATDSIKANAMPTLMTVFMVNLLLSYF
jgi:hypothetical protein